MFLGLSLGNKYSNDSCIDGSMRFSLSTLMAVAPAFPVDEGGEEVSRGFKRTIIIIKHAYIDRDRSP